MRRKTIDFNSLLIGANMLVAGLLVWVSSRVRDNEYVNAETIALAILLCVQTHVVLLFERRRRDPFVILLAFEMIIYYALRIFTLALYPFSIVFDRYPYHAGDSNYALIYIIVANVFLYAGLHYAGYKNSERISADNWRAISPSRAVFLLSVTIVFAYISGGYWTADNVPRVLNFLVLFISPTITTVMAIAYYVLFRKSLSRKFALTIAILIVGEIVAHTLWGSRSAIVGFIQNWIVVVLGIAGCIKLSRRQVFMGLMLLPIALIALVVSFTISTYNRSGRDAGNSFDVGRSLELAGESRSELSGSNLDILLPPVLSRAGFFDFSAEIIAHRDEYAGVLNLSTYAKSIVDNVLTPGFDVYDQPKISNAMRFTYEGLGTPSKERVQEEYQSDQLGIYGEFYGLFAYASLPLFFVLAFMFKRIYSRAKSPSPFVFTMKRVG
jgi:hypothetical protein